MAADRRRMDRGTPDRRGEKRRETPWWGYLLALAAAAIVLAGFWSLVY
ncbi:MAG: hypothetical protein ACX93N_08015 [Pseudohaliea sp.]